MSDNSKILQLQKKNKAEIISETVRALSLEQQAANKSLKRAGEILVPFGCDYLGSVAVHYYSDSESSKTAFSLATQVSLEKVTEGLADFGEKQLKKAMMAAYGRTPPRTR